MKRILLIAALATTVVSLSASSCGTDPVDFSIRTHFGGTLYAKAVAVAKCESGLNPRAVSPGGGNWGLFQINVVHAYRLERMGRPWSDILNPYINAEVARQIYNEVGWRAWSCA